MRHETYGDSTCRMMSKCCSDMESTWRNTKMKDWWIDGRKYEFSCFSSLYMPCLTPSTCNYSLGLDLLFSLKWIFALFAQFFFHVLLVGLLSLILSILSCTPPFSVIHITFTVNWHPQGKTPKHTFIHLKVHRYCERVWYRHKKEAH